MPYIMNQPNDLLSEAISGFLLSHKNLKSHPNTSLVTLKKAPQQPIHLLSGGGSGHEPAHIGFVGEGMLTTAIYGNLFSPPTSADILKAIELTNQKNGVFCIVKNFEADLAVFHDAITKARRKGIPVAYVVSHDDISVEPKKAFQMRHRGLAGTIFLHKMLGAAAQKGSSLKELEDLGQRIALSTATIGFATRAPFLPQEKEPLFTITSNAISYGIGIHGEEGYSQVPFTSSEQLAIEIVNKLKLRFRWKEKEHFALLVNNLGTTSELEQAVFLNDIAQLLELEGLSLPFIKSGRFMTSLDMKGISVSLCKLDDDDWLHLLDAPTTAPAW